MAEAPAIALEGAKGVGKTETALRRAATAIDLSRQEEAESVHNEPGRLATEPAPLLLDEWQRLPAVWDQVRTLVDRGADPGRFLLAGSAAPLDTPIHSGAGRIIHLRMRPLSLAERGVAEPTVSLARLLDGDAGTIQGETGLTLADYAREIARSGLPGLRGYSDRLAQEYVAGYLADVAKREFPQQGLRLRQPDALTRWLRSYAAATGTTATYSSILDGATPGESDKPARKTTIAYREVLSSLWLLDEVPAHGVALGSAAALARTPKHFLADPAFAASLLGVDADALTRGVTLKQFGQYGSIAGRLFEALVRLDLQVYASHCGAELSHLRTAQGTHEIDFIVRRGLASVAVEVKLAPVVEDSDVRHLNWLARELGDELVDRVVVTTGSRAYRRKADGVAVVPAALLGP
jgi:predicted AAA+ superfamily ATPase